ncbi:MAG: calcium/sodium antiporter [Muribaculaceae bacterium]|nr:calcium/sodium antiporter [Muribaculaceae bacterium]
MIHDIIFFLIGLLLLVLGANYVTDGAVAVAKRFKVSNLIIGLTVVALGSTLPDMVVCVESAFEHKPAMAIGEVIGSNTFDLLLVVGIMGLVRPMKVDNVMLYQDLPIMVIASVALWVAGDTVLFDGMDHNIINRSAGIMLIVVFIFYMWFMILSSRKDKGAAAAVASVSEVADADQYRAGSDGSVQQSSTSAVAGSSSSPKESTYSGILSSHSLKGELRAVKNEMSEIRSRQWFSWVMIVAGLVALVIGGNWVVDGASGLALKVGMSQGMVALTVVAIGNALPDLVTSVTATVKGASGIALGNIVGSCIINALLSVGLSALVLPLKADSIGFVDFITLVGASVAIWLVPLCIKSKSINRLFGIFLTLCYVAYMTFTVIRG